MKEKYNIKTVNKYFISTLGAPTLYLKIGMNGKPHMLVEDIEAATKTLSEGLAHELISMYRRDTGDTIELGVFPIEISYDYYIITGEEE